MEFFIILAISLGAGWMVWSIRGPKVQTDINWNGGELTIDGPVSSHRKQEIHEFFASQFADIDRLRVTVFAYSPSRPTRPRIQIRGAASNSDEQSIRNFLASRLL